MGAFPTVLRPGFGILDVIADSGLGYHYAELIFPTKVPYVTLQYVESRGVDNQIVLSSDGPIDNEVIPAMATANRLITSLYAAANGPGTLTIHDDQGTVYLVHTFGADGGYVRESSSSGLFTSSVASAFEADWSGDPSQCVLRMTSRPPVSGAFLVINEEGGVSDILTMMGGGFPFEKDKFSLLRANAQAETFRVPASDSPTKISVVAGGDSEGDYIVAAAQTTAGANVVMP